MVCGFFCMCNNHVDNWKHEAEDPYWVRSDRSTTDHLIRAFFKADFAFVLIKIIIIFWLFINAQSL